MDFKNIVKNEREFSEWFVKNHKKLGYDKIVKKDSGDFPDFIMLKNGKEIRVELETLASNFILHKHDVRKVDHIICVEKDCTIPDANIIEIDELKFVPRLKRVSATIDESTFLKMTRMMNAGIYRNKSHLIEEAIKYFEEKSRYAKQ